LGGHRGYQAIQAIGGLGPVLAAVFVAEIGYVCRGSRRREADRAQYLPYGSRPQRLAVLAMGLTIGPGSESCGVLPSTDQDHQIESPSG
jgi:hypothetical protein